MKQYPIQLAGITGWLIFLLVACSNESPSNDDQNDKELLISAEIIPANESKAADALASGTEKLTFTEGDQISVSRSDTKSRIYELKNQQWLPKTGDELTVDGTSLTYNAVYPSDFVNILEDQNGNSGGNYTQSNKLAAEVTTASNYVPLKFNHAFTKITMVISYGNDSKRKNVTATLSGNNIRTDEATAEETIKMLRTVPEAETASVGHTFICILNPGDTGNKRGFKLTVSGQTSSGLNAENETYTQALKEFKPGYNYIYNFSSNDNLILNSIEVKAFATGGTSDVGNAT